MYLVLVLRCKQLDVSVTTFTISLPTSDQDLQFHNHYNQRYEKNT